MCLSSIESILNIEPSRYVSLVKACRLYRNALWMVESDTNLSWLLFVSALEAGAKDVFGGHMPTKRSIEFVTGFRPDPPEQRPESDGHQLSGQKITSEICQN